MDVRNNEENVMLQTFLNCPMIWPKIRELVSTLHFLRTCLAREYSCHSIVLNLLYYELLSE